VPTGDLPRSMMCLVDRKLCGAVSPGTRVTAVGILSIFQGKEGELCCRWPAMLLFWPINCFVRAAANGGAIFQGKEGELPCCNRPVMPINCRLLL